MKNPLVSIIVPVYNVAEFLPRCIESILSQTYKDFELLLVNDGSIDNSGDICNDYAQKDNRIRVFHKENGGAGAARKFGVQQAKSEWIEFVDADDFITPDNLEGLFKNASKGEIIHAMSLDNYISPSVCGVSGQMSNKQYIEAILSGQLGMGPVAKIIKRSLFDFDRWNDDKEIKQNEDLLMMIMLACNANNVYVDKDLICYHYIYRNESASKSSIPTPIATWLKLFQLIERLLLSQYSTLPCAFYVYQIKVLYLLCIQKGLFINKNLSEIYSINQYAKTEQLPVKIQGYLDVVNSPLKQRLHFYRFILIKKMKCIVKKIIGRK